MDTAEAEVNTTKRHDAYCRKTSKDGRVCSLYEPHEGDCKPKHGTEADRFKPGE